MSQDPKTQTQSNYSTKPSVSHNEPTLERITDSIQKKLESIVRSGKRFRSAVAEVEE